MCSSWNGWQAAGYTQYEISNFAKPGYESRHNTMYWRNQRYYGLRCWCTWVYASVNVMSMLKAFSRTLMQRSLVCQSWRQFEVSREEAMEDFMMVGLRMLEGVRNKDFMEQFGERSNLNLEHTLQSWITKS